MKPMVIPPEGGLVVAARSMRDMTDVSAAWVARAVEDNEAEFLLALGRAGGGRERDDAEITWVIGGSPVAYHNCVVRADLEPERADAAITESQNLMRTSGVAGSWHVGPSMRPTDLGTRLEAHGFEGGPEPGMAADLRALPDVEAPTDVRISRVVTDTGLDAYEQVLSLGFGEGPPEAAWVREMYARIGVGDDVPWRHYVGLSGGDPGGVRLSVPRDGRGGPLFRLHRTGRPPPRDRRGDQPRGARRHTRARLRRRGARIVTDGATDVRAAGLPGGMRGERLRVVAVHAANHGANVRSPGDPALARGLAQSTSREARRRT